MLTLCHLVSVRQWEERSVPLPEGSWVVVPLLLLPSALQVNRQLKERLVVVLVRTVQSPTGFPSALQLHPQLKDRLVEGLEQQREVCPGEL